MVRGNKAATISHGLQALDRIFYKKHRDLISHDEFDCLLSWIHNHPPVPQQPELSSWSPVNYDEAALSARHRFDSNRNQVIGSATLINKLSSQFQDQTVARC